MSQLPGLTTTAAALVTASLVYVAHRHYRLSQPRRTVDDMIGNSYTTGSDVVRVYGDRLRGKVVVITGTTSGLGEQTARLLGQGGAHVIMGVRQPAMVQALVHEIYAAGGTAEVFALDLASLASVKTFCYQVQSKLGARMIDIIINNAGVSLVEGTTEDGYQTVWQVNCMAAALLTEVLLPSLSPTGRVINVSSQMHQYYYGSAAEESPPKSPGSGHADYGRSKACQVLHAMALQQAFAGSSRRAMAIEPGLVATKIGRHTPQWLLRLEYHLLGPFLMRTVDQGCATTLYCAAAPAEVLGNGVYYANCQARARNKRCTEQEARQLDAVFRACWAKKATVQ